MTTTPQAGYAPVNGLNMYYAIYGTGEPLILLHGGFGLTEMFGPILPGTTHYTIFTSPALAAVVRPFLDAPMPSDG
jgi:pimeloyl-ACP methyl ester carboxylesterase